MNSPEFNPRAAYYEALEKASKNNPRFYVDGHDIKLREAWNLIFGSSEPPPKIDLSSEPPKAILTV